MDVGTVLSVVQTLLSALQCLKLREICSVLGYKTELDNLERTVNTVKDVLLDAEAKADDVELTNEFQHYIEELKDAVYDADDLLDEFVTLAECKHKKLLKEVAAGKAFEKVRRFFLRIKDLPAACKMSTGVKGIRKRLDAIADNHNKFGFKFDSQPIRKRREQTCSYVYAHDIIGRDADMEKIVEMLLNPNGRRDVSFLTIVGMGGLGKTTLAQLIYNDERITTEFPTRLWACVADEDPNHLNVEAVLVKVFESITGYKNDDSTPDSVQRQVREKLAEKKYLLVLDDVWNENRYDWEKLENFLKRAPTGSWVVVTTRSSNTAAIVEDGYLYELQGLSDEDSWNLFERTAFKQKEAELVEIGKKIVKKCANVPLAIKVVGSLLYGQGEGKWLSFEQNELVEVSRNENSLFHILKFSYNHLDSQLKSCFSYCALFPKDHRINKEKLIRLWMAQGFIVPLEKGQSSEDAGEGYFLILLRRCFFQDVKKDEYGDIISFKLHDLMHDVAKKVSEKEICAIECITDDLNKKIRHLFVGGYTGTVGSVTQGRVRTLLPLNQQMKSLFVDTVLENWMCLRALDLSHSEFTTLPSQITKLLHLRYLDLSWNRKMEVLPKSLTKLHNLETLMLEDCRSLRELPNDLCRLVKLRCLDTWGCNGITHMPAGMNKLSCLHKLTMFTVDLSKPDCGDVLEGLKGLTAVKGGLEIRMKGCGNAKYEKGNSGEGGYLMNKQHLNHIYFEFYSAEVGKGKGCEEALMEDMKPHNKLKRLELRWYKGEKLGSWARGDNLAASLPNLVEIQLWECHGLKYVGALGKLGQLRSLKLRELSKLEYMEGEEKRKSRDTGGGGVEDSLFFPSLKVLELWGLPMMKGWWREGVAYDDDDDDDDDDSSSNNSRRRRQPHVLLSFPQLSELEIRRCPKLALILTVPNVEQVILEGMNEKLRVRGAVVEADREREGERGGWPTCSSSSSSNIYTHPSQNSSKLRKVITHNVGCLTSLPSITHLTIAYDAELERLEQVREMWRSCCSSSLRMLTIIGCDNLKSVVKEGMEHLTALEGLEIRNCPNVTLNLNDEKGDGDGVGKHITASSSSPPFLNLPILRSLSLAHLPKMVNLPEWMQHLTSLHSLSIWDCHSLESLPEWMPHLTALEELSISSCDNLRLTQTQTKEEEGEKEDIRVDEPFTSSSPPLPHTLRSLYLEGLPHLVNLPESMQHLTSLHSLDISNCKAIESLPDWIPYLTSLTHLDISYSSEELKRKCSESPPGQDWTKIHHIPHLSIQ